VIRIGPHRFVSHPTITEDSALDHTSSSTQSGPGFQPSPAASSLPQRGFGWVRPPYSSQPAFAAGSIRVLPFPNSYPWVPSARVGQWVVLFLFCPIEPALASVGRSPSPSRGSTIPLSPLLPGGFRFLSPPLPARRYGAPAIFRLAVVTPFPLTGPPPGCPAPPALGVVGRGVSWMGVAGRSQSR